MSVGAGAVRGREGELSRGEIKACLRPRSPPFHAISPKPTCVRSGEGEMTRTIALPTQIQPEKVQATYEHGVLTLQVPQSEAVKPKQIEVKVNEA